MVFNGRYNSRKVQISWINIGKIPKNRIYNKDITKLMGNQPEKNKSEIRFKNYCERIPPFFNIADNRVN